MYPTCVPWSSLWSVNKYYMKKWFHGQISLENTGSNYLAKFFHAGLVRELSFLK